MVPFESASETAEAAAFEVNYHGVARVARRFLPLLRASAGASAGGLGRSKGDGAGSGGRLVVVGSIAGLVGRPLMQPYSASKAAVRSLADSLRRELRPLGVSVSRVDPGFVATRMLDQGRASLQRQSGGGRKGGDGHGASTWASTGASTEASTEASTGSSSSIGARTGVGASFAAAPANGGAAGEAYEPMRAAAMAKLAGKAKGAPSPEQSTDAAITHALTARRPRAVYHPGAVNGRAAGATAAVVNWLGALDPAWADLAIAALS